MRTLAVMPAEQISLKMDKQDLIDAWRNAEQDLGIDVNLEFTLGLKNGTKEFIFIKDFGGPKGAIVTSTHETKDFKELQEMGFYCSALADSYSTYDRLLFVDTLNDWKFFGEANKKPGWYTGKGWT
jgi:hypothetical protein